MLDIGMVVRIQLLVEIPGLLLCVAQAAGAFRSFCPYRISTVFGLLDKIVFFSWHVDLYVQLVTDILYVDAVRANRFFIGFFLSLEPYRSA
jgi:hypothetical protein